MIQYLQRRWLQLVAWIQGWAEERADPFHDERPLFPLR